VRVKEKNKKSLKKWNRIKNKKAQFIARMQREGVPKNCYIIGYDIRGKYRR
tara:strand:+ start:354 stop:506 length:153 start_codon:yes stop_codon:yes gene_type:complete